MKTSIWDKADEWAGKCATAALNSSEQWTIEDVCRELSICMPRTHDDLIFIYRICKRWRIKHNLLENQERDLKADKT